MKTAILAFLTLSACTGWAQTIDSSKTKPANSLSNYKEPSRFSPTQPTATSASQPVPAFKTTTQSRAKSTYIYENGRITGGSTSFKLGKRKD